MPDAFEIEATLPVPPERLYAAWIDGDSHAAMTGSPATSEPAVGGRFTAWNGFIEGEHLALDPPTAASAGRIVQTWRTKAFPSEAPASRLEIDLAPAPGGTWIAIRHSNIPSPQGPDYQQGWVDRYFTPIRAWAAD